MGPRWKGKGAEANAFADPMSKIVSKLQCSLIQSDSRGILSGCDVLVGVDTEQTDLFSKAHFGRFIISVEKEKQWVQLSMEEAFYLHHSLNCLKIAGEGDCTQTDEKLWKQMTSKNLTFPDTFKAYSHLRDKNWVVRGGAQYGVDFVAYRHHPSLVHSDYAVLVLSDGNGAAKDRLRVWSDFECTLRLCGGVAKTLLVLYINKNGKGATSPSCLEGYTVEERTITRWSPEQHREDIVKLDNGTKTHIHLQKRQNIKSLAIKIHWRECEKCCHMVQLAQGCYHIYCRGSKNRMRSKAKDLLELCFNHYQPE